MIMKEINR